MEEEAPNITFTEYQEKAAETAVYPFSDTPNANFAHEGLLYVALGLAGEAGEVANKVKKILRDNDGLLTPEVRGKIASELGDVLWYVAELSRQLGHNMGRTARANLSKLSVRSGKDLITGTGDYRAREYPPNPGCNAPEGDGCFCTGDCEYDPATGTGEQLEIPEVGSFGDEVDDPAPVDDQVNELRRVEFEKRSRESRRRREVL